MNLLLLPFLNVELSLGNLKFICCNIFIILYVDRRIVSRTYTDKLCRSISTRSGELLGIDFHCRSTTNFIPCLAATKLTAAQLEFGFGGGNPRTPIPPSPSDRNVRLRGTSSRVRFAAPTVAPLTKLPPYGNLIF